MSGEAVNNRKFVRKQNGNKIAGSLRLGPMRPCYLKVAEGVVGCLDAGFRLSLRPGRQQWPAYLGSFWVGCVCAFGKLLRLRERAPVPDLLVTVVNIRQ